MSLWQNDMQFDSACDAFESSVSLGAVPRETTLSAVTPLGSTDSQLSVLRTVRWGLLKTTLCVWILFAQNVCLAHPFHTTIAEMEFNSQTGRFEVSMKIHPSDFEAMVFLSEQLKPSGAEAEKSEGSTTPKARREQQVARYLKEHFVVHVAGTPLELEWCGSEEEPDGKWLYFELKSPTHPAAGAKSLPSGKATLTNKVLCDSNKDQINTVVLLGKARKVSFKTHAQETTVLLPPIE